MKKIKCKGCEICRDFGYLDGKLEEKDLDLVRENARKEERATLLNKFLPRKTKGLNK